MISKELLKEVLKEKVIMVRTIDNNIHYTNEEPYFINKYELAHKCKEWAKRLGWTLQSGWDCHYMAKKYGHEDKGYYSTIQNKDFKMEEFKCDSELEAIFKACEWIMEQKNV